MIQDVLFYSMLVWIILYLILLLRQRAIPLKLSLLSLPLNAVLAVCLWCFYFIFGFTMGFDLIGRGYRDSVYVETSNGIDSAMGFAPTVSVPLDEVIGYYGDPDSLWFTSASTTEGRATGLWLYWDSVEMFVELRPIADKTYPVRRKTRIERIIFYDARDVAALAGQQVREEKTRWTGYGNYQP